MDLRNAAETAIHQCMELESDESCVVVTDDERWDIGMAIYDVACEVTDDAVITRMQPTARDAAEPPAPVAAAMKAADVVLAPTTRSLTHTKARIASTDNGGRVATLPGVTEGIFVNGLDADYAAIKDECDRLVDQVIDADEVRVTTEKGTDITIEPGDRKWLKDMGLARRPGYLSNLPAGEVFVAPVNANGTYVVDGSMKPHGLLEGDHTIEIEVEDGYATSISDETVREEVEAAAEEAGDDAYNIAEFGIGANTAVSELVGTVLLDEKAAGTVHIAIGDDSGFGGDTEVPVHLDGVIRSPTVYADGEPIDLPAPER